MMRILIICSSIIPFGGTEKAIANMAHIFSQFDDAETFIVSISSHNYEKPAFDIQAKIQHLGLQPLNGTLIGKIKWYFVITPILKKVVKKFSPNIILSIGHNISFIMPLVKGNHLAYACEHIDFFSIPNIFRFLMKFSYKQLSGIIVLSEKARYKIRSLNNNIKIIPNSLEIKPFDNNKIYSNELIMVGRISPEKGYERIIPIVKKLKERKINVKINIYGDGPKKDDLNYLIEKNNLKDMIDIHGYVKDIEEKYKTNSILLLTSYTEALPMVIIEANSNGLPVIAYENEGTNELIKDSKNGFLIQNDDIDSFVNKIALLMNEKILLEKMGRTAYEISQSFSEVSIKSKWRDLLNES